MTADFESQPRQARGRQRPHRPKIEEVWRSTRQWTPRPCPTRSFSDGREPNAKNRKRVSPTSPVSRGSRSQARPKTTTPKPEWQADLPHPQVARDLVRLLGLGARCQTKEALEAMQDASIMCRRKFGNLRRGNGPKQMIRSWNSAEKKEEP